MRQLLRRIVFYIIALWAAVTINFFIPRLAPGNPAQVLVARFQGKIPATALASLEQQFGISHDSLWTQYWQYISNLLRGNFGLSLTFFPTPVIQVIRQDLPWTLILVGVSVIISFVIGTFLGIFIAWRRGSFFDTVVPPVTTIFSAVPYFWLALLLLYVVGFTFNWVPLSGGYDTTSVSPGWSIDFFLSVVQHALLPALTIVLASLSQWLLGMRNTMITILTEDYVLLAQAKGLPERRVVFSYAARNAILPNVTGFALALGFVVSGSLVTEMVFSYPGIGFALLQAVQNLDYPLMQGIFLFIAIAVLAANFLTDLLNAALDPRVR